MRTLLAGFALGSLALAAAPAPAVAHHNDWAAPLVGGALGGYALSSLVHSSEARSRPTTTYVEPAYVAPTTTYVPVASPGTGSIEARLRQLDQLAAGGYITKQEYDTRRAAILDGL